jgi:nitrogen fixation protein
MAQQVINIGTAPNDGTGDQLRTAFDKCNDNFTELYAGGPGGGAVDSVNGQTGDVVLDATDLDALQRNGSNANSNINIGEYELKAGQFTLDTSPTGTAAVGTTRWNNTLGSAETTLKGGSVILKNGVDLVARVVNKVTPNATLTKAAYQAVRVSGAQGQRLAVAYAQANNDNNSADTIGLVCETIATNQEGFIITVGQLEGINTTGSLQGETWADGDVIYLSPTTAGALTNVKPNAPGHIVIIGYVEYAHAVNGKLYVKIMNGWELDELHNVNISSPTNNQILAYNSSTQLWENESINTLEGLSLIGNTDLGYYNNLSFEQNFGYMVPIVGATTYSSLRATTNVIQAGVSADFANVTPRMLYASITTAGNFATQRGTGGGGFLLTSSLKFYWKRRFQIDSSLGGTRFVCGLSSAFQLAAPTNVEPDTLINIMGVCKLSTSSNLYFFWNDGTGTATTVDLGVDYPANNVTSYRYDLEIFKESGTANITLKLTRIDASGNRISTSQIISTNYNTATNQTPVIYITNNATTGSARFFDYGTIFKNYNLGWDTI